MVRNYSSFILDMMKNYLFCAITGCITTCNLQTICTFSAALLQSTVNNRFCPQYDNKLLPLHCNSCIPPSIWHKTILTMSALLLAATLMTSRTATHPWHDHKNCHVTSLITLLTESLIRLKIIKVLNMTANYLPLAWLEHYHWFYTGHSILGMM